ncbi:hypothetical protein Holit_00099 [Hollandina sp. SP2]
MGIKKNNNTIKKQKTAHNKQDCMKCGIRQTKPVASATSLPQILHGSLTTNLWLLYDQTGTPRRFTATRTYTNIPPRGF